MKGDDYVSFVATDNLQGGRLAGEQLAKLLNDTGKVVMLRYAEGSESTTQREAGFLEAIEAHKGIQVVSANQYGGADVESAFKKSEALLSGLKKADGSLDVDGIFTPNESTTRRDAARAAKQRLGGQAAIHRVRRVRSLVKALADGHIDGLVLQDPVNMGYLGVKTMVAHLKGNAVDKRIDTGVRLVTRDQMNDPDAKELLQPDLAKWLKN